ncbi:RM30 protein, partial [Polypterus senegalus]
MKRLERRAALYRQAANNVGGVGMGDPTLPHMATELQAMDVYIIQPLKLPQGFPTEEELTQTYLKSTGELVIEQRPPKTADKKTIAS